MVKRLVLVLVVTMITIAVMVPTIVQTRHENIGQPIAAEKGKGKGKGKEKAKAEVPTSDRFVLFSDGVLFALGTGALLVGGGILVYRVVRTESLN